MKWILAAIRGVSVLTILAVLTIAAVRAARQPSTTRDWQPEQNRLATIAIDGDIVEIRELRDFAWRTEHDFTPRYATRHFDLRQLDSVDYVISRFGSVPGLAHASLTFGFDGDYVSVSVEARKERASSIPPSAASSVITS